MELFFRKEGSGPPMIIVHGLYGSSDNWLNIAKKLRKNYTVYMVDQRNHGHSSFSDSHTFNEMKTDLAEFFFRHSLMDVTLLGHSMGGKTVMWFAADYPEKINRLIVADIAPVDYLQRNEHSQFFLHQNILLAMKEIDFERIQTRDEIESFLVEKIDDENICRFLIKNTEREKSTGKYRWRLNVEVLYNYLDEIVSGVNIRWFEDRLPITNYPVSFIRGCNSSYILPEDEMVIKRIYPDAQIIDIKGAGHWLHAEKPEEFLQAIYGKL
jgi:pimeloyl-ACP methyl ester carboxylesterase